MLANLTKTKHHITSQILLAYQMLPRPYTLSIMLHHISKSASLLNTLQITGNESCNEVEGVTKRCRISAIFTPAGLNTTPQNITSPQVAKQVHWLDTVV